MGSYSYSGPVTHYNKVVANNWKGETEAPTKVRAQSNLEYQFKKYAKLSPNVGGIKLCGTIKEKEK